MSFQATWAEDTRRLSCPEFSPSVCADRDVPDHLSTSRFAAARWQASAAIGLGKGFVIAASIPVVLKSFAVEHQLPDGTPYTIPYSLMSGSSGPVAGLGDAQVKARLTGRVKGTPLLLDVGLGAYLPTGRTSANPFDPSLPASQRQPRQFGNGTIDPLLELGLVLGTRPLGLLVQGSTRLPLYSNPNGYQGQLLLGGSVGVMASLPEPVRGLVLLAAVDLSHASPARWSGEVARNSGGDALAVRLGFEAAIRPELSVRGQLVASPYQVLLGEQFVAPVSLGLGVSGLLDLRPKSKRHGH